MNRLEQDKALVSRLIAGDERAFVEFADHYVPALHRFALSRLRGDRGLAQEVVQDTLCKAIAKLPSFRGEAALMTWLCACCRNEIAAHFRRRRRVGVELDFEVTENAGSDAIDRVHPDGPDQQLMRREAAATVHEALDCLPPHYGRALEWKYIESLPVNEIAKRLEMSPKAAESLLTRARTAFRREYDQLVAASQPRAEATTVARRLEASS